MLISLLVASHGSRNSAQKSAPHAVASPRKTPARPTRGAGAPNFNGGKPAPLWVKGRSGNPSGRPSSKPISDAYNRILDLPATALGKFVPKTQAEIVAWAMIRRAANVADKLGVAAAKEVTDRVEGTPDRTMRLTDHTGKRAPRVRLEFTARGPSTIIEHGPLELPPIDDEDDDDGDRDEDDSDGG